MSNYSEDCLYLNLWKPANESKDAPLNTAMIYFFGGAFDQGSAMFPLYNGEPLAAAADDIVVVVCNYRVGVFGFLGGDNLRSSTDNSTGNWGIQDQRACAQWVHDNAEALHVNTSRVLFFGESAGAASVGNHLAQKESWHLFNRAIMESGPVAAEWMALPLRDANTMLASFASKTGCASAPVLRTCLEKLSSAALWAVRREAVCLGIMICTLYSPLYTPSFTICTPMYTYVRPLSTINKYTINTPSAPLNTPYTPYIRLQTTY